MGRRWIQMVGVGGVLLTAEVAAWASGAEVSPQPGQADLSLPPTREQPAALLEWVDLTEAEFLALSTSGDQYLPEDHVATRRLQFWVDRFDAWVRQAYPSSFATVGGSVPRPKVHVRMAPEGNNAFVLSVPTCVRVPIRFAHAVAREQSDMFVAVNPRGKIGFYPLSNLGCLKRTTPPRDPAEVVQYLLKTQALSNCSVSVQAGELEFAADCRLDHEQATRRADGISLTATSNHITVDTGLISRLENEGELVSVLLHELAHFYRTHGALNKSAYRYFYDLTAPIAAKPEPVAEFADLGARIMAFGKFRTQPIVGQRWHSELFSYAAFLDSRIVAPTCGASESACYQSCSDWRRLVNDPVVRTQFGSFPQAVLRDAALTLYWQWEEALGSCLAALTIADVSNARTAEVALADVKQVFWRAPYATQAFVTVAEAADAMSQGLLKRDREKDALLQQALDQRVGFYTTEEEADNLALQWLPALGFAPETALSQWWVNAALHRGKEQDTAYNFSYERCLELYQAVPRWSQAGREVAVPVGNFAEDHHSSCFRIYNIERRWRAQAWTLGERIEGDAPGGTYAQVRELLDRLQ